MKYYNNQKYCDCQLIALVNASVYFNKLKLKPNTKLYNYIAREAGCIYGACIDLTKAEKYINAKYVKGKLNLSWIKNHLPVKLNLFCFRGFHSVLCIKVTKNKLQLVNYRRNSLISLPWNNVKKMHCKRSWAQPEQIIVK